MKTEGQVRQKLKQVLYRHLKKRLRTSLQQASETCVHNGLVRLGEDLEVSVCVYTQDNYPRGVLCDARFHQDQVAKVCPLWEPAQDKAAVKAEFNALLESGNRGEIASEFPDAAALMWVLDSDVPEEDVDPDDEIQGDPEVRGWNWSRWPWSKKGVSGE